MKIKDLKEPYRSMALIEQEVQRYDRNEEEYLGIDFIWGESKIGFPFWNNVDNGYYPEITPEIKLKFPTIFGEKEPDLWQSTPDNPCWVLVRDSDCHEKWEKQLFLADLGSQIEYRFLVVDYHRTDDFLAGEPVHYEEFKKLKPYKEAKISIEVNESEVAQVEEFIKKLRK